MKNYYNNNLEKFSMWDKEWRSNNRQKINDAAKERRKDNPEKTKKILQRWRKNNPEKVRETSRKRRARKKSVQESFTPQHEAIVRFAFSDQCFRCGSKDGLHIDHHLPLSAGYPLTLDNAVLLCQSCNCSKGNKMPVNFYTEMELFILDYYFMFSQFLEENQCHTLWET